MTDAATLTVPTTTNVADIEMHADSLDPKKAAEIYAEHGCLVVRGLMTDYAERIRQDIARVVQTSIDLLPQATKNVNGWGTPNGALFLPAPEGFKRDKQIMTVPCSYTTSAAFFMSAVHEPLLDVIEAVHGPNIELFMNGQCLNKEPVGGHPKHLHQDASYFEHKYEGPCAVLNYAVDTTIDKGALYVVPGSHKLGVLEHVDTFSHLGLDPDEWPWDRAVPVEGRQGDAIFFHVKTIHGSQENHTDTDRPVFIHRYRRADDYVVVNATNTDARAEAEKAREQAKKENQMGFLVRGFREYEPERQ